MTESQAHKLWRTRQAVDAAAPVAEVTGRHNLLEHFNLASLEPTAARALHVDYSNPDHQRLFDPNGKLKGPPQCKQLYRQKEPLCRWDLAPLAAWPAGRIYDFHPYPIESIQRAMALQPGTAELPQAEQGEVVGPDREALAIQGSGGLSQGGSGSQMVGGYDGVPGEGPRSQGTPELGRGKRALGKRKARGRREGSAGAMSVASGDTGDTTTQDTVTQTSRRPRTDNY